MVAVNEGIEGRDEAQGGSRWAVLGILGLPNLLQLRSENLFLKEWLFKMICGCFLADKIRLGMLF